MSAPRSPDDLPLIGVTCSLGVGPYGPVHEAARPYVDAVVMAGGVPVLLPVLDPRAVASALRPLDALLLTGGGDIDPACYGAEPDPSVYDVEYERDAWELALVAAAEEAMPVLGVCRGAQILNVAHGGSLVQDLPERTTQEHRASDQPGEEVHTVDLLVGSLLASILDAERLRANTLHHQSVDRVGDGLEAVAWADDGPIEAVEAPGRPVLGVQWHPELLPGRPPHHRLFEWLIDQARS